MRLSASGRCPFFKCFSKNSICCYGNKDIFEMSVRFSNPKERELWFKHKCKHKYSECAFFNFFNE